MKIALVGINAKYIHKNLAIRYLKENCKYPIDLWEFTTKTKKEEILEVLKGYQMIGFSCYIWNIEMILLLCKAIKNLNKDIKILFGGPEVSFEYEKFFKEELIDYLIKDEGEIALNSLVEALIENKEIKDIPNLVSELFDNPIAKPDLRKIKLPYEKFDTTLYYVEFSRGCKYKCSYCQASLSKRVRYFNKEEVKKEIEKLVINGAKMIKFLDRNFTNDLEFAEEIFAFLKQFKNYDVAFQFEVNLDIVPKEFLITLCKELPYGLFRFEVGVQTLNSLSNKAIRRSQNNEALLENLHFINQSSIITHVDLIAGLPLDNYQSFKETFNIILKTKPNELQLGILKSLPGTTLRKESKKYGLIFSEDAPYTIQESGTFSFEEIEMISLVSKNSESLYNKKYMKKTFNYLLEKIEDMFLFFLNFPKATKNAELSDLFLKTDDFINKFYSALYLEAHELLIIDYLKFYKMRPVFWFKEILAKEEKNLFIQELKISEIEYSKDFLYRYSHIIRLKDYYLIAIYHNQENKLIKYLKT